MAIPFKIDGKSLDELMEVANIADTSLTWRKGCSIGNSDRFLINGVPINEYLSQSGKIMFESGATSYTSPNYGYKLNGNQYQGIDSGKGETPYGLLVKELGVGEHIVDVDDNDYITIDNVATNVICKSADKLKFLISAGGGGGAGSGLVYCSGGGGGAGSALMSFYEQGEYHSQFPYTINVGAGGNAGGGEANGGRGGDSSIKVVKKTLTGQVLEKTFIAYGGEGGKINDEGGGAGGTTSSIEKIGVSSFGGAGGSKEKSGSANNITDSFFYRDFLGLSVDSISKIISQKMGGGSNGSNYGGGGGASGLADGATGNSRKEGISGTLGAGGSGAGFTAFQTNNGGKGGDGIVKVYY